MWLYYVHYFITHILQLYVFYFLYCEIKITLSLNIIHYIIHIFTIYIYMHLKIIITVRFVRFRFLSFSYVAAFNLWLMVCPSALSHDWQMNSLPLVTSLNDVRNIGTCVAVAFLLYATCKILSDIDVSLPQFTYLYPIDIFFTILRGTYNKYLSIRFLWIIS